MLPYLPAHTHHSIEREKPSPDHLPTECQPEKKTLPRGFGEGTAQLPPEGIWVRFEEGLPEWGGQDALL